MLAICALAIVIRLVASAIFVGIDTPAAEEPAADSRLHAALTQSVLAGNGFAIDGAPTAITPPLYVAFLAVIYRVFGGPAAVRIIQALLGGLACFLAYEVARRHLDRTAGLWAALIVATFPHAVYVSALHLTENLFLILLLLVVLQGLRVARNPRGRSAIVLGGLVGLAALTRSAFLAFVPMLPLWAASIWGVRSRTTWRVLAITAAGVLVVLAPWTARNMLVFGEIVPVQSNTGMVFWAGNNAYSDGGLVWPDTRTWHAGPAPNDGLHGWRELGIAEENRVFVAAAARWIREHPREFAALLQKKLARLYGFSKADGDRLSIPLPVKLVHVAFMASAAAGLAISARSWRSFVMLILLIAFTNFTTLVFSGGSRYLIPMLPALAVFGAAGLSWAERRMIRTVKLYRVAVGA